MKSIVLSVILFIMVNIDCKAQNRKVVDSFMSVRTLNHLNNIFTFTRQQQDTLYKAGVLANEARRNVFANYWRTDSFKIKLSQADYLKDSLYRSVLGNVNMKIYRDTLLKRRHTR